MRVVILGVPGISVYDNRWKCDLAEDAQALGWSVKHLHAKDALTYEVVRACKGADMLIWSRTHGYNPPGDVEHMLRRIEDNGTVTVAHHMDLYWGVATRTRQIGLDPWWSCQYVFTADGGHQEEFAERGVNHYWCPPAIGSHCIGRGQVDHQKYPGKYIFVGGYYRVAHGQQRMDLINWARGKYGSSFQWYGPRTGRPVWGPDLNDLYSTAHVSLGDSAPGDYYWSDRVVNTLGRGGVLAHLDNPGFESEGFSSDVMITYQYQRGFSELATKLHDLSPKRRLEMSDAAMTMIEERHTWKQRLLEIQETVFNGSL